MGRNHSNFQWVFNESLQLGRFWAIDFLWVFSLYPGSRSWKKSQFSNEKRKHSILSSSNYFLQGENFGNKILQKNLKSTGLKLLQKPRFFIKSVKHWSSIWKMIERFLWFLGNSRQDPSTELSVPIHILVFLFERLKNVHYVLNEQL